MKSTRPGGAPAPPAGCPRRRRKWLSANARVSRSIPGQARPGPASGPSLPGPLNQEATRKYLLQLLPEQTPPCQPVRKPRGTGSRRLRSARRGRAESRERCHSSCPRTNLGAPAPGRTRRAAYGPRFAQARQRPTAPLELGVRPASHSSRAESSRLRTFAVTQVKPRPQSAVGPGPQSFRPSG